jgi:PAS domain S-box-containing protein
LQAYKTLTSAKLAERGSMAISEEAGPDLRAIEERFGKAFAQAAVGMSLADTKGRFLQVNDAFCNILGFTREELAEIDSYAITHPEDRERYVAFSRQMLAGEINDYVIEKRCLKKDGSVVWVRKSVSLTRDAEGEPSDIITLTEDITVRKHAEDALARKARLIALTADVGIALTRIGDLREALQSCVESVVKHVDAALARIWTLDAAGTKWELQVGAGMYTQPNGAEARTPLGALEIGIIARMRQPLLTNDVAGDPRIVIPEWVRKEGMLAFAGYPLIVENRLVGVAATFARRPLDEDALHALEAIANSVAIGIERKKTDQAREELLAREKAARHEAEILNHLGNLAFAELDLEKLVQAVTDAASELTAAQFGVFRYSAVADGNESKVLFAVSGAVSGMTRGVTAEEVFKQFPPRGKAADLAASFGRAGGMVRYDDIQTDPRYDENAPLFAMPAGRLAVRSYLAAPVVSRSGEVIGGLFFGHENAGVFTEAHERIVSRVSTQAAIAIDNARLYKAAELARVQAQSASRDLERSNTDLERFALVASHDLQEPLRMVTSFSQLLARRYKGQLDERADEYLEYILSGTKRMAALIDDLLSYSQIVHSTEKGVPVDCGELLDKVLESCRVTTEESGAVVTRDPLPTVDGDEGQISQLFHNLLTNALKYQKREVRPEVHVSAQRTANEWLFSFRDNGIGIAKEHLEQIFVIFKRLHKKTEYPGTGIGLALCQRIIEGRAGRIWVESEPGSGSTFYFTWPDTTWPNMGGA